MNRENLLKLADYLDSLPADYQHFDMALFMCGGTHRDQVNYALHNGGVGECGAVACAVGHGPAAGILVPSDMADTLGGVNWGAYTNACFVSTLSEVFIWMFGGEWQYVDNTPRGAAARIRYLLDGNKVPEDWLGYPRHEHKELYRPYLKASAAVDNLSESV